MNGLSVNIRLFDRAINKEGVDPRLIARLVEKAVRSKKYYQWTAEHIAAINREFGVDLVKLFEET